MAIERFQRSIRFSNDEWNAVIEAAERNDVTPACRVCPRGLRAPQPKNSTLRRPLLTPGLDELIKRTFRGVHLLVWLKREDLTRTGREEDFTRAAEAAQTETLGPDKP